MSINKFLFPFFLALGLCQAQSPIEGLKQNLSAAKSDTAKVNILNKMANQLKERHPDSTAWYASQALELARQLNYGSGWANAQINLGNSHIIRGDYDKALQHFNKAQIRFTSALADDPKNAELKSGLARAHASSGVVYSEKSNYPQALENYLKALNLYKETGQSDNISKALNNIGVLYMSQQNYPKALDYLGQAHESQKINGDPALAVTLMNMGAIYFETGKLTKAKSHYDRSAAAFKNTGNDRGMALLQTYLGNYYLKQANADAALTHYKKSLELNEKMGHKFGSALALYKIGQMLYDQSRFDEAFPYALKSLDYAKSIDVLDQAYHSEKLISELYSATGNPELALSHFKNYIVARDSIQNREVERKFAAAGMNHEYEKKEALLTEKAKRQNQLLIFAIFGSALFIGLLLVLQNRQQVKRRLTLQKEVAEYEQKALHLQMNPHFVFNCLSSISSFIVQNGTDSALNYLSKFSKLMRLTLEYSKGSLIPIDKEIESLQNYLELEQLRFHNKFDFEIVQSERVEFNVGLPPLLIQPFVENAILHGLVPKEDRGMIKIGFDSANGQLICSITDNGIGIAGSQKLKENSVSAHRSMALEITKKRLQIMEQTTTKQAQIEITDLHHGNKTGTRVMLILPIQYI